MFSTEDILRCPPNVDYNVTATGLERTDSVMAYTAELGGAMASQGTGLDLGLDGFGAGTFLGMDTTNGSVPDWNQF